MRYELFKTAKIYKYSNDEIKLHIKRLERKIKELQNKYNTALLREKEMFSKEHTIKNIVICNHEFGRPKDIKFEIEQLKNIINDLKNINK